MTRSCYLEDNALQVLYHHAEAKLQDLKDVSVMDHLVKLHACTFQTHENSSDSGEDQKRSHK